MIHRAFGKEGLAERYVAANEELAKSTTQSNERIESRLVIHMGTEETQIAKLIKAGFHACDALDSISVELNLNEDVRRSIAVIKNTLGNGVDSK